MELQRLGSQDVSGFDCGVTALNNWLHRQAKQSMRGRSAVVYLAYQQGEIVGYFSLSNSSVLAQDAPARIRIGQPGIIPLVLIGRLAIDRRHQGQGKSLELLSWALQLCLEVAERSGVVAIVLADDQRLRALNGQFRGKDKPTNVLSFGLLCHS